MQMNKTRNLELKSIT